MVASAIVIWAVTAPQTTAPSMAVADQPTTESRNERPSWQDLCHNFTTNIVTWRSKLQRRQLAPGQHPMMGANAFEEVSWAETNEIAVAEVRLDGRAVSFDEPLDLGEGREYWIVGPGVLDAQFSANTKAIVRIINCIFKNRTTTSPDDAGIDYVLDGGAYLNFTELPATESMKLRVGTRIRNNGMSEGRRWWRIKGPDGISELIDEDRKSSTYSATMQSF